MEDKRKIAFASDHAGWDLKVEVLEYLKSKGYSVVDLGPYDKDQSYSYAEYGEKLGKYVQEGEADLAFGFCGTGLGISYALNRYQGIRSARIATVEDAYLARLHNDANSISLGGRTTDKELAFEMVDKFLETNFEGGRHITRIEQLDLVGEKK